MAAIARSTPKFPNDCRTAAIQGPQRRGQVSANSDAPTAHSPPIPSGGQKAADQKVPPGLRDEGEAGEEGVGKDSEYQGRGASKTIAQPAEKPAPQRPAHEERRLNDRSVIAHRRIALVLYAEQLGHERGGHQRVEVHVQAVEKPAEPRGDTRLPLLRRKVAQPHDLSGISRAGGGCRQVPGRGG